MKADIRETELFRESHAVYSAFRQPGTGQISDVADVNASPAGTHAVFSAVVVDRLEGSLTTRVSLIDLQTAETRLLTYGPNNDRAPKYSPDGKRVAFLSDRHKAGDAQLYILDLESGAARAACRVEGWVEYLHWSPDGARVLLGAAGHGADVMGGQGAITSSQLPESRPSWMPVVESGTEDFHWRRAWVYDVASGQARRVSGKDCNVWEAAWCGNDALIAVTSAGPGEGLWYSAKLTRISLADGAHRDIYSPRDQIGVISASPSGRYVAFVQAVSSDRGFVAGDLHLIDVTSGEVARIDTAGVDVTHTEWQSDRDMLTGGHRGFETVAGLLDPTSRKFTETWRSDELTTSGRYFIASGLPKAGDCVLCCEEFRKAPEIAVIAGGQYRTVRSFDLDSERHLSAIESVQPLTWNAPDGLEIQGWLLRPQGSGPHPVVMNVHGGPVWHWRPAWLGRWGVANLMLLKRGYALFFPNPRGSSGRGQAFARHVLGDMGGADTGDCLSGLDHLVASGVADVQRLGVTGGSYGGFMSSWLITQDSRFAAAVPVAPSTNHVTQHLISNIPHFVSLFLADEYNNPNGKYFQRSPIMHAHKARTPTLNICGALDRCTPPEEAVQFHNALLANGVTSMLVTYPEEGHGIRKFPAAIDSAARTVDWFVTHTWMQRGNGHDP